MWEFWRLQRRTTNHVRFIGSMTCFCRSETGTAVGGKGAKCFSFIFLLFKKSYKKLFSTILLAPSGEEPWSSRTLGPPAPVHTSHRRTNEQTAVNAAPVLQELPWDSSWLVSSAKRLQMPPLLSEKLLVNTLDIENVETLFNIKLE